MHKTIDPKNLNTAVRAQDDFFEFATGGWNKRHPIPADKSRWGTFDFLREQSKEQLRQILEPLALEKKLEPGSPQQQVRDLWISAMDEERREVLGLKPLEEILKKIDGISTKEDLLLYFAWAQRAGVGGLWGVYVGRDDKNSSKNALILTQGGLSLPDRDFYLNDDPESKRVRDAFAAYIPKLLKLVGYSTADATRTRDLVLSFETELARASMTRVERRDPHLQYNKRTLASLQKEAKHIDWKHFFTAARVATPPHFIVSQPGFLTRVSELYHSLTIEEWQYILRWSVIDDMAPLLTKKLVAENFRFYGTVLSGQKKMQPLWKRAVGIVDGTLGGALGKLYVERFFSQRAKRQINELVDNLFEAYHERLKNLEWMSAATKKKAFVKLRAMKRKLGYPSKWESYKGLAIHPKDFVGNLMRSHEYEFDRMLKKLKKAPDPHEWYMTPPTVNAYFDPNANEIAFPAGIMQWPFFDEHADEALNYGGIGSVIGHEITHGFDDEGRKFDHKGNLKDWWTPEDRNRFEKRAKVLADQFDQFEALPGCHVNGKLTLGENIADLGGLIIAFEAFKNSQKRKPQEVIGGFTPEQRFFLGYAATEAGSIRPELLKKYLVIDPHSPSIFRVNGPLSNMEAFYQAFGLTSKDKLYREEKQRARIW